MAKTCSQCIYQDHDGLYEPCYSCLQSIQRLPNFTEPYRHVPTNFDRLRTMSIDDVANFLATITVKHCSWRDTLTEEQERWLKWLEQESKGK